MDSKIPNPLINRCIFHENKESEELEVSSNELFKLDPDNCQIDFGALAAELSSAFNDNQIDYTELERLLQEFSSILLDRLEFIEKFPFDLYCVVLSSLNLRDSRILEQIFSILPIYLENEALKDSLMNQSTMYSIKGALLYVKPVISIEINDKYELLEAILNFFDLFLQKYQNEGNFIQLTGFYKFFVKMCSRTKIYLEHSIVLTHIAALFLSTFERESYNDYISMPILKLLINEMYKMNQSFNNICRLYSRIIKLNLDISEFYLSIDILGLSMTIFRNGTIYHKRKYIHLMRYLILQDEIAEILLNNEELWIELLEQCEEGDFKIRYEAIKYFCDAVIIYFDTYGRLIIENLPSFDFLSYFIEIDDHKLNERIADALSMIINRYICGASPEEIIIEKFMNSEQLLSTLIDMTSSYENDLKFQSLNVISTRLLVYLEMI